MLLDIDEIEGDRMMIHAVTLPERIGFIAISAGMAVVIFALAKLIHRAISKNDFRKEVHGQPICWWVSLSYFVGACFGVFIADNHRYVLHEVVGGMGGFGLLGGLMAGSIHGTIRLLRLKSRGPTDIDRATPIPTSNDDCNPYAPPSPND